MSSKRRPRPAQVPHFETLEARQLLSISPFGPAPSCLHRASHAVMVGPALQASITPATEDESNGGASNNDSASAQPLIFQPLMPGDTRSPQQSAVIGQADGEGAPGIGAPYDQSGMIMGYLAAPNTYAMEFTDALAPGTDGLLTITAKADLAGPTKYLTVKAEGIDLGNIFVEDGQTMVAVTTQLTITQAQLAALAADGVINFTITPSSDVARISVGYVNMQLSYSSLGEPTVGTADFYKFDLSAGQSAGVTLTAKTAGQLDLQILDASGTLLASGADSAVNFVAGSAGTYYVRVAGSGEYNLAVSRGASAETSVNDTIQTAQPIASPLTNGQQWVSGSISSAADRDFYAVTLAPGSILDIRVQGLEQSATFQPTVRLYDANGNLVAIGHGRDRLEFSYLRERDKLGGTFYIEVAGADSASGDYALSVEAQLQRGKSFSGFLNSLAHAVAKHGKKA